MTRITAWQHIFTSVERERSPNRRRGYQTLFYSRDGLNDEDVRVLESRAQYYSTPDEPIKRQFFWLSHERWVVSQVFALAERDEFGRKGRYLAHSLVLPEEAWHQLGQSPFGIWAAKPFVNSLDQAFERGNLQNGNLPPATFQVNYEWQDGALGAARRWSPEALTKLARLAWQAQDLQAAGEPVMVLGPQTNIAEALVVAFLMALPDERRFLTFDTHAPDCNWGSRDFWAQGFPAGQELHSRVMVEASARRIQSEGLPSRQNKPYERWMERVVIPQRLDSLVSGQDWALALDSIIRGLPVDRRSLQGINPQFVRDFAELNADDLRLSLKQLVPTGLSPDLARHLLDRMGRNPHEQLLGLVRGLTASDVGDILYQLFLDRALPPAPTDQEAIAPLAEAHPGLRRLLRLWAGDVAGWRQELDALSPQDYQATVTPLLKRRAIPSWKAISPQHIDDWFEVGIDYTLSTDISSVAQALAECGGSQAVNQLAGYVPQLPPPDQQALQTWLKRSFRRKAPQLQEALDQALGKPESAVGRLKGWLRGSDEEKPDAEQPGSKSRRREPEPSRREKPGRRDRK